MKASQRKAMFAKHGLENVSRETLRKILLENLKHVNQSGKIGIQSRQLNKLIKQKLNQDERDPEAEKELKKRIAEKGFDTSRINISVVKQ